MHHLLYGFIIAATPTPTPTASTITITITITSTSTSISTSISTIYAATPNAVDPGVDPRWGVAEQTDV